MNNTANLSFPATFHFSILFLDDDDVTIDGRLYNFIHELCTLGVPALSSLGIC